MTVAETLLIYAAIPLAIVAVLALLTMRPNRQDRRRRYRPGQPWEHEPVWYSPHPEVVKPPGHVASDGHGPALAAGATRAVLTSGAPRPARTAGPLGGARGTW